MSKSRLTGRIGPFFVPACLGSCSPLSSLNRLFTARLTNHESQPEPRIFGSLVFAFYNLLAHHPLFADLFVLFIYWLCPASSFQLAPRPFSCSSIGQSRAWPGTRLFLCTNLNAPLCSYRIEGVSL
ncbi:hypothetical protein M431DRAFT_306287 [Trichoderma harzianum CBS 226.95]|uniref:Uncharacterized protein n=1 Tax=Trichoderma harzianum CBS 226.95 TaxID=983964 RepID=A0A2T4AR33_TRIHA|nr:hypothetical protein M431DRAFT_306287 [Trichoderma harzianum CBS 226.95]PTB59536.1 hypothetical protein M431DRAFT_306287 [Trichoderma harzianum CBS 226.95]